MKDNSKRPLGDLRQVVQTYLPSLGNVSDTGFTSHVTRLTISTIHASSGIYLSRYVYSWTVWTYFNGPDLGCDCGRCPLPAQGTGTDSLSI